jgi:RND family efflux transporter MFP subunit
MRALLIATTICAPGAVAGVVSALTPALEAALKREPVAVVAPRQGPPPAALTEAPHPAELVPAPAPLDRGLIGVFVAREAADVAASSSGRLAEVRVQIGDRVRAGEVVASLNAAALQLDLAVAEAQARELAAEFAVMRARAEIAGAEDRRVAALGASGLASGGERAAAAGQHREATLRSQLARAGSSRQQATIQRLLQAREERHVLAPFDGVVVARYADPGSNVGPERPILRIVRDGPLTVRFALPEQSAVQIRPGLRVRARAVASGAVLPATVRRIAAEVDGAGRFTVAEAETDSMASETLAGAAAEVFEDKADDPAR